MNTEVTPTPDDEVFRAEHFAWSGRRYSVCDFDSAPPDFVGGPDQVHSPHDASSVVRAAAVKLEGNFKLFRAEQSLISSV